MYFYKVSNILFLFLCYKFELLSNLRKINENENIFHMKFILLNKEIHLSFINTFHHLICFLLRYYKILIRINNLIHHI